MSSVIAMASTLQPSHGPHSPFQVGGGSTDSFFDMPQPRCPGSGTDAPSKQNDANRDSKIFSTGLEEFNLPSFNVDFALDTSIFANSKERGRPVTQQSRPPTAPAAPTVNEPPPMPEIKLPKQYPTSRVKKSLLMERPRSWLGPGTKAAKEPADSLHEKSTTSKDDLSQQPSRLTSCRSLYGPESFAHFARRSRMSRTSRSSTTKETPDLATENKNTSNEGLTRVPSKLKTSKSSHRLQAITNNDEDEGKRPASYLKPASSPLSRATSYLSRMKSKQQTSFFGRDGPDSDHSCASSATSLHRTSDSIRTSASRSICSEGNTNTPITDESCNETTPKLRDPLWSNFKSLDAELKSFNSAKQTAPRVAQVQSILLPFLRGTRSHPSNKTISLEDVERRAVVLNKWWTSLLDMLHGPLPQPIPGMDRPILLEAATMLMMRPEWRQSTTSLLPLSQRSPLERVRSRSWTNASGQSTADSFAQMKLLAESAEHNVRTMFVANLIKQMAYVVEKMSLRHAPLSLVNFSGKTCAYAFFFAPGVADVLVRLWGLTPELIRRTGIELGLPRKDTGESDDISALFPPTLSLLGWSSPRAVWDSLKQIPNMSLLVARIPWTGPWVTRWKGRDTDLFFIFCKYFHVLSDQFTPTGLPLTEKARAPAFALVQAQLLSIVDSTIHRQTGLDQSLGAVPPLIDAVNGSEASALALPLPPTNLMKSMSENRLVILLKDFFSDDACELSGARHTYAETFATLVKGAARKTSLYNNTACFALCDFLEEVLMIYHEFETAATTYVDWPFWIDVCKKMSSSMNTMTEVRLLSFVFTVWDAIAKDSGRKATVCLEWLLTEESFNTFFNNWCPMVRAYYQRLVCWRMCRYTGQVTDEMDINIYLAAAARLKMNWAHHLYLKRDAEENGRTLPSTAPMSPAMGKKFMIIRQEANLLQKGLFMGFDTFARTASNQVVPGTNEISEVVGEVAAASAARPDNKKRWSLIGKVLSMTSGNSAQNVPDEQLPKSLSNLTETRRELVETAPLVSASHTKTTASETDSLGSSPVFDEQRYIFKFILGWQQNHGPARDRILTRPRLPAATQARISDKSRASQTPAAAAAVAAPAAVPPPQTPKPVLCQLGDGTGVASRTASVEEWLRNTPPNNACVFEGTVDGHDNTAKMQAGAVRDAQPVSTTDSQSPGTDGGEASNEQFTKPIKPSGIFAKNAVYSGRALAEWSQVVSECNIFTERRQDDGVERLCDVEVPFLGVDGFRKVG
ncbi:hypothetical protein E4U21_004782 [Claviceps maximensis]|nr:hypothetical protein E4U21_004782 [Claviceps maximensis]